MALPDVAGWAAHKVVESQFALVAWVADVVDVVDVVPPPPQLVNSAVRVSKTPVQRFDCMQEFFEWGLPIPVHGCRGARQAC